MPRTEPQRDDIRPCRVHRIRRIRRPRHALAAIAAVCATLLSAGCSGASAAHPVAGHGSAHPAAKTGSASGDASPSAGSAAPSPGAPSPGSPSTTIEEIAAAIGCAAEVSVQAEELRQGGCESTQGPFRIATFAAERGLRSWLTEAQAYGGLYLVGDRWVVTAQSADALGGLRGRIGGSLENGADHTGH
ncbi:hypothetical protein [Streptomyces sp. NPDC058622]|uniref:hypothetical protein n=2 Tax=unclassified Streptomyces TaxID=2593676 RepID=UPI0036650EA3